MPAVTSRVWQFTHLSIPLWGLSDKTPIKNASLEALESRLRRRFDGYAGVSFKYLNDESWATFEFHGGINEDDRRRILPDIKECLPADATLRWEGSCVETTVHIGGWVESVATMDPNRTRE